MTKIIDLEKIEKLLADESKSAYGIEKVSGISRDIVAKLRRGDIKMENLTIKNASKLMNYVEYDESIVKKEDIELRMAVAEVKKNEIHKGVTQEQNDMCPTIIKEFDNLEDALAELKNYQSSVYDLGHGKFEVTEYYIEVSRYDEIDGEPVGVIDSEAYFAKGDYHTEHKFLGDFGDYDLTKMDNDILVEFHENVNRKDVVKYLPDYDLDTFEELVEEYEDAEDTDERESKLFAINDLLGI
ncbi:hypothetical protein ACN08A_04515 [Enterococcus cecorum]|uniref:hypothetical protein n=1 Tax=Enterococcus cecorum TaxID=44008 RepID=UPI003B42A744